MEDNNLRIIVLCLMGLLIISAIIMIFGAFTIKSILKDEKSVKTGEDLLKKYPGIIFIMIPGFNIIFVIVMFLVGISDRLMKKPFRE